MQHVHRISAAQRDAILASSYPKTYTVMRASGHLRKRGWQGISFSDENDPSEFASMGAVYTVSVPPIEYTIQVGDRVMIYWSHPGPYNGEARAVIINGAPPVVYPIVYPSAFDHFGEGWSVEVDESGAHR